jgi:hypothetical protein
LQASDKAGAFNSTQMPSDYNYDEAATTEPGKSKGLVVMLDAHSGVNFTNILRATFSYEGYMRSFLVLTF